MDEAVTFSLPEGLVCFVLGYIEDGRNLGCGVLTRMIRGLEEG
jgi:hypothetical protein